MSLRTEACIEPVCSVLKNDFRRARLRQRQHMKEGTVEQHSKSCKMKRVKNDDNKNNNNKCLRVCVDVNCGCM